MPLTGTGKLVVGLVPLIIVLVLGFFFFTRFDGVERLKKALGFIQTTFGLGAGSQGGSSVSFGSETQSSLQQDIPSVITRTFDSFSEAIGQTSTDAAAQIVASINTTNPVTLAEAKAILSDRGFEQLEASLAGVNLFKPADDVRLTERQIQEQISLVIGTAAFGAEFANPFGAFANPDFFIDINTGLIIDEGGR